MSLLVKAESYKTSYLFIVLKGGRLNTLLQIMSVCLSVCVYVCMYVCVFLPPQKQSPLAQQLM